MGMGSYVVGFKPPDAKFNKMRDVWNACTHAGIEIPDEVRIYFEDEPPPEDPGLGIRVDMAPGKIVGVKEYRAEMQDGFEVDLRLLPEDVKIIRFYNSY